MRLIDAAGFERRLMFTVDLDEICDDCLRSFLDEMAQEKTIDPVKQGKWIDTYGNYSTAECSSCGSQFEVTFCEESNGALWDGFKHCYNYCPNCGAKMIAEEG